MTQRTHETSALSLLEGNGRKALPLPDYFVVIKSRATTSLTTASGIWKDRVKGERKKIAPSDITVVIDERRKQIHGALLKDHPNVAPARHSSIKFVAEFKETNNTDALPTLYQKGAGSKTRYYAEATDAIVAKTINEKRGKTKAPKFEGSPRAVLQQAKEELKKKGLSPENSTSVAAVVFYMGSLERFCNPEYKLEQSVGGKCIKDLNDAWETMEKEPREADASSGNEAVEEVASAYNDQMRSVAAAAQVLATPSSRQTPREDPPSSQAMEESQFQLQLNSQEHESAEAFGRKFIPCPDSQNESSMLSGAPSAVSSCLTVTHDHIFTGLMPTDPMSIDSNSRLDQLNSTEATNSTIRSAINPLANAYPSPDGNVADGTAVRGEGTDGNGSIGGSIGGSLDRMSISAFSTCSGLTQQQLSELGDKGFPLGLTHQLSDLKQKFPHRYWFIDHTDGMQTVDVNRVRFRKGEVPKLVPCTRQDELQRCIEYHARLSQQMEIADSCFFKHDGESAGSGDWVAKALASVPQLVQNLKWCTLPLHQKLGDPMIAIYDRLRSQKQEAVIALATDRLPEEPVVFAEELNKFKGLPARVIVRLCTNEERVVKFYKGLKSAQVEVLGTFLNEAEAIHNKNPFLTYALPLHLTRENGLSLPMLDERLLREDELSELLVMLFGDQMKDAPAISNGYTTFHKFVEKVNRTQGKQWNSQTKKSEYWIDMDQMSAMYGTKKTWWTRPFGKNPTKRETKFEL